MRRLLPSLIVATFVLELYSLASGGTSQVLVSRGSVWKYLDDGSNQGTTWRKSRFDDSSWAEGPAQLGYGDGDEATVVSYGPDSGNKYITTYFRLAFPAAYVASYETLAVRLLHDDGAVVYLNGTEVLRSNLPAGFITYLTRALEATAGASERNFAWFAIDPSLLKQHRNVLAVEIHQQRPDSSDISFDLELFAGDREFVTRGPYLQLATQDSVTVRWRTAVATDSSVWFGFLPGMLNKVVYDATLTQDHEVTLSGLLPDRKYFYAVGHGGRMLAGGDDDHFFVTQPEPGSWAARRLWILGDCGMGNDDARKVRDAFYRSAGPRRPDLVLLLGDNAYDDGLDTDYQAAVFDMYLTTLRTTPVWPTRGNHEVDYDAYLQIFSLPTQGEAGGVPSGTEAYYSFDDANVHYLCLDSEGSDRTVGGPMWTWLEADLASSEQEWVVAFWHHPPYSKGSHDSDQELNLIEMRQSFLPLLESYGVDLVLCGHSHSYERSFLIDGHYGDSTTFNDGFKKDGGDGRVDGSGAYQKDAFPNEGAVYCVSGSSSQVDNGSLDHPAMFFAVSTLGSVILEVEGKRLDLQFLDGEGQVLDYFTLEHSPWSDERNALAGENGIPTLRGEGSLLPGDLLELSIRRAASNAPAFLVIGTSDLRLPLAGGVLVPYPATISMYTTDAGGSIDIADVFPGGVPSGTRAYLQCWFPDTAAVQGLSATNAISVITP